MEARGIIDAHDRIMQPMSCSMMQGWGIAGMLTGLVLVAATIAALISLSVYLIRRSRFDRRA